MKANAIGLLRRLDQDDPCLADGMFAFRTKSNGQQELTFLDIILSQTRLNSRPNTKLGSVINSSPKTRMGIVINLPRNERGVISP